MQFLGNLADKPPGLVLEKARLGEQLGLSSTYPGIAEAATNCILFVATNRLLRVMHRQCLTLICIGVSPKRHTATHPVASFRQHKGRI